jgi:hypothetical protein
VDTFESENQFRKRMMKKKKLKINALYSRMEIKEIVGGELQTYLPQDNFKIMAGCFCEKLNPDIVKKGIVQAGNAPKVAAKAILLKGQPNNQFPVFTKVKLRDRLYEYRGEYCCERVSTNAGDIKRAEKRSGRKGGLSAVIFLRKV